MLERLLIILLSLPILGLIYFFYKVSGKYENKLLENKYMEEISKKDMEENKNLEEYIKILENESKQ